MFRHVLVHAGEHPSFALGQPWPGLLTAREEAILAEMEFLPRRRKWLLGRAAAKGLVMRMSSGLRAAEISVLNRPTGEPYVAIEGRTEWEFPISISHRSEVGLAAAPDEGSARIGADVETVAPRDPALARQFFTRSEAELVAEGGRAADEIVACIWSAKEAVLKLLGVGLRVDTRHLAVELDGERLPGCSAEWRPLAVKVCGEAAGPPLPPSLRVVWRREPGHVLTVAVAR
jgi:phosphopantetheinyl transferase